MLDLEYPTETDPFEDAVQETAYIARVDVRYGELFLPERVRAHVADGAVVVHLLRCGGEDDVARIEATLTGASKLKGVTWPEDVTPGTSVTVMCPRGAAGHDIAVLLPPLPEPLHFAYVEDDRGLPVDDNELDDVDPIELVETSEVGEEQDVAAVGELPADTWAEEPSWPGDEELTASETTAVLDAIAAIVVPDLDETDDPRTVFSAALVAVRSQALIARQEPPRRAGWWERRLRLGARLVLAESRTATRVAVGIASALVFSGVGLTFLAMAVTR